MPFNKSNYLDRFEKLKLQIGKDFDQLNFIHPSVEKVATQPEGSPTDGLRYIVGEASDGYGEGAFSECPKNYIAEYDSRLKSWTFFKPYVGMEVIDKTARYLKKYTGTGTQLQWTNYMSFSVSDSGEIIGNAQHAGTADALANSITFSLSGAVEGVTDPAVNLSSSVTIPTTLDLSPSNSAISGILPIGKGGTGNNEGKVPGLNHNVVIRLSGGVISDPSDVTGSDFSTINFGGNEDNLSTYPHTKTLYDINVTSIDADCIDQNILSKEHGGTGNDEGKADSAVKLKTSRTISLSNMGSGSVSFDGSQNVTIPLKLTLPSDGVYNTDNITGILPVKNGGTGNIIGNAPSAEKLDHSLMIKITGAVTGEWDISEPLEGEIGTSKNLASNANDSTYALYRIKTTKLNISNPDYLIGPLPPSKGGTGRVDGTVSYADSAGSANSANSASSSTKLSKYFKLSLEDQNSNNFGNSSAFNGDDIKTTNPQGTITLPIKVTTIPSSIISGAYPSANVGGFIELKQSPIYLKNGSETIGTSDHKIGEGYSSININLDTSKKFPKNMHYDPTEVVSPTYTRVAVDSKGHIIRGSSTSYLKKTTFKNLPYIYDISSGNTFIRVIKKDDSVNDGTVDFGSNAGYISYYTRPFTFFNDSNIYISNSDNANIMTISVNVNFNGLRFISTDENPNRFYRHHFDILLTNTNLSNCTGSDDTSSLNYLNLIRNNVASASSSTFLNGCYSLFGSSNGTFENCGLNIYNRNTSIIKYDFEIPVSGDVGSTIENSIYYTSVFNYSKNIIKSDISNNINFANPVYGIIKLSMPTYSGSNDIPISFNSSISEPYSNYGNYGHTLRLVTPRIDFEYNSY